MKRKYNIILEVDTDKADIDNIIRNKFKFDFGAKIIDVENVKETRTTQQNRALHLWFTQLAQALNEKHIGVRMILDAKVEVEWTPVLIKEILWRKLQKAMFGKQSTRQLFKSKEIDQLFDTINSIIIERTNGEVILPPFPNWEDLSREVISLEL